MMMMIVTSDMYNVYDVYSSKCVSQPVVERKDCISYLLYLSLRKMTSSFHAVLAPDIADQFPKFFYQQT